MAYKCKFCSQYISNDDMEDTIKIKNRYAHRTCFEIHKASMKDGYEIQKQEKKTVTESQNKIKKARNVEDVREGLTEEEYKAKKSYYEYIKTLLDDGQLKPLHYKTSERYMMQLGFDFKTMEKIAYYIFSILEKPVQGNPIALIPYYAAEADQYYKELDDVENENKDKDITKMYKKVPIKVKPNTGKKSREWTFD